jgi:hypothetical protein
MPINVFYNLFVPPDAIRAAEVMSCFAVLLGDQSVSRIVVLSELNYSFADKRVHLWPAVDRPTFDDYFRAVKVHSGLDDVNVILNSDCFIDPATTRRLERIRPHEAYCVTRHELASLDPLRIDTRKTRDFARRFRYSMQDCWVFRGPPKPGMWLSFCPGRMGCDNRLAYELKSAGYAILDPHLTVRVMHLHVSGYGTLNRSEVVPPPYAYPRKSGFRERVCATLWDIDACVRGTCHRGLALLAKVAPHRGGSDAAE